MLRLETHYSTDFKNLYPGGANPEVGFPSRSTIRNVDNFTSVGVVQSSACLRSLVNHGFDPLYHFLHFETAPNAKINGMGAALACASIDKIPEVRLSFSVGLSADPKASRLLLNN